MCAEVFGALCGNHKLVYLPDIIFTYNNQRISSRFGHLISFLYFCIIFFRLFFSDGFSLMRAF